jgi:acyl carrier protein
VLPPGRHDPAAYNSRLWRHRWRAQSIAPVAALRTIVGSCFVSVSPSAALPPAQDPASLERELAALFVQALNLETPAEQIDPTASLFGDGLGLDSIDILEVALEVSQRYGFQLRSDDENNQQIFANLRSLAAHVAQHRTK